jgi:hypothetical protein
MDFHARDFISTILNWAGFYAKFGGIAMKLNLCFNAHITQNDHQQRNIMHYYKPCLKAPGGTKTAAKTMQGEV